MSKDKLLKAIEDKYKKLGVPLDAMLEGLLWSTPITYWDYIQTDALLGLQIPRTDQPDEMVFIMYHQVNELLFKMILWEIDQVAKTDEVSAEKFAMHLMRISRYFDMLSNSFTVMAYGMERDQYLKFRNTLTPASGFQSAQYRKIEFASTELINLIDARHRETIDRNSPFKNAYDHLYWQAAGKNHNTGEKSVLIKLFDKKYMGDFIDFMEDYNACNLSMKFKQLPKEVQKDATLIEAMRHYDYTVNVKWVLAHYDAAGKYLGGKEKELEATGGSSWRKYLHPKYAPVNRYARDIIGCLNNWVDGWIDWNMVLDTQGGPNWFKNWCVAPVIVDPEKDEVYFTPIYYTMVHFSKYIRPQAEIIEVKKSDEDLMVTAAKNTDGTIAVVIFNEGTTQKSFQLSLGEEVTTISINAQAIQTILINTI